LSVSALSRIETEEKVRRRLQVRDGDRMNKMDRMPGRKD